MFGIHLLSRVAARRGIRRPLVALEQLEDRCLPSVTLNPTYVLLSHELSANPLGGPGSQYGYSPAQLRHAYGFDAINFQSGGKTISGDGSGQTIAIVNAYDDPTISSDLAAFDQSFGLPAPPCFVKVGIDANGSGSTTSFPSPNPTGRSRFRLTLNGRTRSRRVPTSSWSRPRRLTCKTW
jgi:hypothetical protein